MAPNAAATTAPPAAMSNFLLVTISARLQALLNVNGE